MQVLDKGQIGLLDRLGNDETIAKAAWVSYGKQEKEHSEEAVAKVIKYMMTHKHGTPFEHVVFQFYVKAPIFVAREWFRHRIGSFNEISGRYVTFEPEFYIPEKFRIKAETNKQGSIFPENLDQFNAGGIPASETYRDLNRWNAFGTHFLTTGYEQSYEIYCALKEEGIANELARMVLPLGMYTQYWWTVNLRSLFNFMELRSAENAQYEIQEYSKAIEEIVAKEVPIAYNSWVAAGRVAP